jgi:hypothetical protein
VELLRARLGPIAGQVRFVDMTNIGRNPGRIIPGLLCAFVDEHRPGRVRVVGEPVWVGRSTVEYPACVQHEALINLALADRPVTILCPYDAARLDPAVLTDAASTHPILVEHAEWRASPSFADPAEVVNAWNRPLPEPNEVPTTVVFAAPHGPRQVRRVTHEVATRAGLTGPRLTDLLLAVHEVAVNTALHTGRPGLFSIWCDGGQVVCQVQDSGHITDRLAGRRCPAPTTSAATACAWSTTSVTSCASTPAAAKPPSASTCGSHPTTMQETTRTGTLGPGSKQPASSGRAPPAPRHGPPARRLVGDSATTDHGRERGRREGAGRGRQPDRAGPGGVGGRRGTRAGSLRPGRRDV